MPDGDIYEVRVEGTTAVASRWNNVYHWRIKTEAVADQLFTKSSEIASEVRGRDSTNVVPLRSAQSSLVSARATRIFPTSGVPAVVAPGAEPGGVATDAVPPDVALVTTKVTAEPGRSFQGRFFLSGVPAVDVDQDELLAAVRQAWADAAFAMVTGEFTDQAGNVWEPVVFSPTRAAADPVVLPVAAVVELTLTDTTLRNMRPRGKRLREPIEGS